MPEVPLKLRSPLVERAYNLAASGKYEKLEDIEKTLKGEGYEAVLQHLMSPTLRRALKARIRARPPEG